MELVSFSEFLAEIETTFSNFSATNDIDRVSVKGWVIECLRKFGKNICEKRETIIDVKNSKALLPEAFRSMVLGLKLTDDGQVQKKPEKRLIVERQKIENPAYWSDVTMDYFADFCNTKITTEKIYTHYEYEDRCYNYAWLSVVDGIKSDSIDTKCLNLNPIIRNSYPDKVSITGRTMRTNFSEGKIYLQYNSLPSVDEEVAIPIISTGSIKAFIENEIKLKIAEPLMINEKNAQSLSQLMPLWLQQKRQLFIEAKSEANYFGLKEGWQNNIIKANRRAQNLYNLPK